MFHSKLEFVNENIVAHQVVSTANEEPSDKLVHKNVTYLTEQQVLEGEDGEDEQPGFTLHSL